MTEVTQINPYSAFENSAEQDIDYSALEANIIPQGPYLVVLPARFENRSKGGILLTGTSQEVLNDRITVGKVLRIGKSAYRHSKSFFDAETGEHFPWCKEGDWVLFSKLGNGIKCQYAGINYWVLSDTQVLAKVEDPSLVFPNQKFVGFETADDNK